MLHIYIYIYIYIYDISSLRVKLDGGEVNFMNWALYLPGRSCWKPLNMRLGGSDSHLKVLDKKEVFVAAGDRTTVSLFIQSVDN